VGVVKDGTHITAPSSRVRGSRVNVRYFLRSQGKLMGFQLWLIPAKRILCCSFQ
jgi:hypothetical protein